MKNTDEYHKISCRPLLKTMKLFRAEKKLNYNIYMEVGTPRR